MAARGELERAADAEAERIRKVAYRTDRRETIRRRLLQDIAKIEAEKHSRSDS